MTSVTFLLLITSVLTSAIGLYVLSHNPRDPDTRVFALMTCCVTIWGLAIGATLLDIIATWSMRIGFAAASPIPGLILVIVRSVALTRSPLDIVAVSVMALGAAWSVLALWPTLAVSVRVTHHTIFVTYGPLHPPFAIYVISTLVIAAWVSLRAHHKASGLKRLQLKYLSLGILVPAAVVTVTNLLAPLLLNTSRFSAYGPFAALIMIVIVGHAILRHRLMAVRIVIQHGVVYGVSVAASGVLLFILLSAARLSFVEDDMLFLPDIILALAVAASFSPIKHHIHLAFDRYLYREPYDYQHTIKIASRSLASTIDLHLLLLAVTSIVRDALRVTSVAIYLHNPDADDIHCVFSSGTALYPSPLGADDALLREAHRDRRIIFRDDIALHATPSGTALKQALDALRADVVVPLVAENQLIGLVVAGPKRSGDSFFSHDADLLATLANQAAVAFRNAQGHQKVLELSAHLQQILTHIDSGVVAINQNGLVTLFNGAAESILHMSGEQVRRRPIEEVPGPVARLVEATLQDGAPRSQVEILLPNVSGQPVPFACSTARLHGTRDFPVGAVAVFSDLSRLKEQEAQRRRAERIASLEAIASGLVHEIRNPLVAIKTFSQLLPVRFDDAAFREQSARVIGRQVDRIDGLLMRFRTLAAPPSAPMGRLDVRDPIQATLETLGPRLEGDRIAVRMVGDDMPRTIVGNASQLEQLFGNLCVNAIDSMAPGGELTVRITELADASGGALVVEIADTGPGIPEDLLASIFDPFVTTKATGTGLGLAICRSIADVHCATLRARNNPGHAGATFTIEFPMQTSRSLKSDSSRFPVW